MFLKGYKCGSCGHKWKTKQQKDHIMGQKCPSCGSKKVK